jgi:hypothetical protein
MADTRTAADKVEAARIRDWARDNGWPDLGPSGRIPAAARQAWASRTVEDDDAYPGSDDPGPPYDDGGGEMPPPASLDEARQRAGLDPDAAHLRGRGRRQQTPGKDEPVPVTRAVRRDITGKLAFWMSIPAEPWQRVDPYCGGAYAENFDKITLDSNGGVVEQKTGGVDFSAYSARKPNPATAAA